MNISEIIQQQMETNSQTIRKYFIKKRKHIGNHSEILRTSLGNIGNDLELIRK